MIIDGTNLIKKKIKVNHELDFEIYMCKLK